MNRVGRLLVALFAVLVTTMASGHPFHGDGPPITKEQLPVLAQKVMQQLVQAKQLGPSWNGQPVKEVTSRETPQGLLWVVSYNNPAEVDKAKRTVYMFFDEFGNFLGGNHTGKTQ